MALFKEPDQIRDMANCFFGQFGIDRQGQHFIGETLGLRQWQAAMGCGKSWLQMAGPGIKNAGRNIVFSQKCMQRITLRMHNDELVVDVRAVLDRRGPVASGITQGCPVLCRNALPS